MYILVSFTLVAGEETYPVTAEVGTHLLDVAIDNRIEEIEGACEGTLACSTCHVVLDPELYEELGEPDDEEQDMLDLAAGLTDTSRLGCQVLVSKRLEGVKVITSLCVCFPSFTSILYSDSLC